MAQKGVAGGPAGQEDAEEVRPCADRLLIALNQDQTRWAGGDPNQVGQGHRYVVIINIRHRLAPIIHLF